MENTLLRLAGWVLQPAHILVERELRGESARHGDRDVQDDVVCVGIRRESVWNGYFEAFQVFDVSMLYDVSRLAFNNWFIDVHRYKA